LRHVKALPVAMNPCETEGDPALAGRMAGGVPLTSWRGARGGRPRPIAQTWPALGYVKAWCAATGPCEGEADRARPGRMAGGLPLTS
jgi:hypothetical protein